MENHIYNIHMKGKDTLAPVAFSELKYLIRDSDIDMTVNKHFPLSDFNPTEKLLINGSRELLECFEKVDKEKMDIIAKLNNIEYIGLSHQKEVILRFKEDLLGELNATGIYDFTYDFLDDIFSMGKFSGFCLSKGHYD
ncbi:hypothetical protein, partial [Cytobacillus praedii]